MSNKKATKRALLTSILAICLCLVMLIGSTFAWFTDTASTSVNKIQSGTLDVGLEMKDADGKWVSAEGKTLTFKTKDNRAADQILWEPGCTYELPELRVVNNGNLALKYKVEITGIVTNSAPVAGSPNLNDVITWTIVTSDRNEAKDESGNVLSGQYYLLPANTTTAPLTIKGHMKEDAGNEYQGLSIEGISVTVYATQYTYEYDSSNNQYDKDAAYKGSQEFTSGTHVLDKGGVALATDARPVAVYATGSDTNVTITGGYYDGGSGGEYNVAVWANDGATVTIKDGYFTVGADKNGEANSVIYSTGGTIIIEGGFFQTDYSWNGKYYVLNQQNNTPGTITVKGGTFVNYDPSKGDDNLGGSFVADGYSVISEKHGEDTWYTVVKGTGAVAGTQEDLNNAIRNNTSATIKLSTAGTYTLPSLDNKDITVKGTKDTVVDMTSAGNNTTGAVINKADSAQFEGVTVKFDEDTNYTGFQHTNKLVYKDCTIIGRQTLYADNVEFINCKFVQDKADAYHVWTYAAKNVTFTDCEFTSTDCSKAVLCYWDAGDGYTLTHTFNDCKFTCNGTAEKSAIMINPSANGTNTYVISINNCTATGYAQNGITDQTIVGVKETVKDTITVNINNATVYTNP